MRDEDDHDGTAEQVPGVRAQAFMEDVSREVYLTHAGHKHEAELQAIYARYADILDDETLQFCTEHFRNVSDGGEEQRAARMMLDWQVEGQLGRRLAALDEREIELENTTVVRLDDREIAYQEAPITIINTADRRERNAIDAARAVVAQQQFAPLALERLQREKEYVEALGIAGSYNQTFELLSGVSLQGLADQCSAFLRDTQAMWDDVLRERLSAFGVPLDEATRVDVSALLPAHELQYDASFPSVVHGVGDPAQLRRRDGDRRVSGWTHHLRSGGSSHQTVARVLRSGARSR